MGRFSNCNVLKLTSAVLLCPPDPSVHRDCPLDCKVYVGNLGSSGNKTELERSFGYYGPLRSVWVARNPPGFAFVEFEDPRDATDAVRELNGRYVAIAYRCLFCGVGYCLVAVSAWVFQVHLNGLLLPVFPLLCSIGLKSVLCWLSS